jgi:hypothetical protein
MFEIASLFECFIRAEGIEVVLSMKSISQTSVALCPLSTFRMLGLPQRTKNRACDEVSRMESRGRAVNGNRGGAGVETGPIYS